MSCRRPRPCLCTGFSERGFSGQATASRPAGSPSGWDAGGVGEAPPSPGSTRGGYRVSVIPTPAAGGRAVVFLSVKVGVGPSGLQGAAQWGALEFFKQKTIFLLIGLNGAKDAPSG